MKFLKSLHQQKISSFSFYIVIGCFIFFLFLNYSFIYKLERNNEYKVKALMTQTVTPGIELRINPNTKNLEWHYTSDVVENDGWKVLVSASAIKGKRGPIGLQGISGKTEYNIVGEKGPSGEVICQ